MGSFELLMPLEERELLDFRECEPIITKSELFYHTTKSIHIFIMHILNIKIVKVGA